MLQYLVFISLFLATFNSNNRSIELAYDTVVVLFFLIYLAIFYNCFEPINIYYA